jgi:hypothetical protein
MRFSAQPMERPDHLSSEEYGWLLVSDFVRFFNEHRAIQFFPSERICVDESMSQWDGMGGNSGCYRDGQSRSWCSGERCRLGPPLTPTRRLRTPPGAGRRVSGSGSRHQGRCKFCRVKKTVWLCSTCRAAGRETYLYRTKDRASCWSSYMEDDHLLYSLLGFPKISGL